MLTLIKVLLALLLLGVMLLPGVLLLVAAIRLKRILGGNSSYLILVGGVILTMASLEVLAPLFLTLGLGVSAEQLAKTSVILSYVKMVANYVGLLLLGIGFLAQTKRLKTVLRASNLPTAKRVAPKPSQV